MVNDSSMQQPSQTDISTNISMPYENITCSKQAVNNQYHSNNSKANKQQKSETKPTDSYVHNKNVDISSSSCLQHGPNNQLNNNNNNKNLVPQKNNCNTDAMAQDLNASLPNKGQNDLSSTIATFTPDTTAPSMQSMHHYNQCELDVNQLELDSSSGISSDINSQNVAETVRSPSVIPVHNMGQYSDCSMQNQAAQHQNQHMNIISSVPPTSSPQQTIPLINSNNNVNQANTRKLQQHQQQHIQPNRNPTSANNANTNRAATPKITRNAETPLSTQQQSHQQRHQSRSDSPVVNNQVWMTMMDRL
jgi:hypothetical protein